VGWWKAQEAIMSCAICAYLERAYLAELNEYLVARSSAGYRVSTMRAAQKNVDMQRARHELEKHRKVCLAAAGVIGIMPERDRPVSVRKLAGGHPGQSRVRSDRRSVNG
jgi:hypothetical protein